MPGIPIDIPIQFRQPPVTIILRERPMLRTTMPETTIDKYSYFGTGEHDIGAGFQNSIIDSESQSSAKQLATQM